MAGKKRKQEEVQTMEVSKGTGALMTVIFAVLALVFIFPIILVFINSLYQRPAFCTSQQRYVRGPE